MHLEPSDPWPDGKRSGRRFAAGWAVQPLDGVQPPNPLHLQKQKGQHPYFVGIIAAPALRKKTTRDFDSHRITQGKQKVRRFASVLPGNTTNNAENPEANLTRMRLANAAVFGAWLLVTWLVFSFMAGIFHQYYTVALARTSRKGMRLAVAVALVTVMCGPIAWTGCTIAEGHHGSIVTAGPSSTDGFGGAPSGGDSNNAIATLLQENASEYRWAAAITGAQSAAGYQLASELPVMAIGGFNGSDPSPTLDQFKSFVEEGLVRYYISSNGMGGNQMGGSDAAQEIAEWVSANFEAQTIDGVTVYDLSASNDSSNK